MYPNEEQEVFEAFAAVYPHEVYATWPERFWEYFQRCCPGVPRGTMERLLERTDRPAMEAG